MSPRAPVSPFSHYLAPPATVLSEVHRKDTSPPRPAPHIESRTSELVNIACCVWPLPKAYDNGNRVVPDKWYPLDTDPVAFRGMKPNRMTFMGRERRTST